VAESRFLTTQAKTNWFSSNSWPQLLTDLAHQYGAGMMLVAEQERQVQRVGLRAQSWPSGRWSVSNHPIEHN